MKNHYCTWALCKQILLKLALAANAGQTTFLNRISTPVANGPFFLSNFKSLRAIKPDALHCVTKSFQNRSFFRQRPPFCFAQAYRRVIQMVEEAEVGANEQTMWCGVQRDDGSTQLPARRPRGTFAPWACGLGAH